MSVRSGIDAQQDSGSHGAERDPFAPVVKRLALTPAAHLAINITECIEGYWDGRQNAPMPGANRSDSYAHGWFTGMGDGRHRKTHWADPVIVDAYRKSTNATRRLQPPRGNVSVDMNDVLHVGKSDMELAANAYPDTEKAAVDDRSR